MSATTNELATLAARAGISAASAYALPAVVTKMAAAAGMSERAFVAEAAFRNPELRDYVAQVAAQVAVIDARAA